MRNLLKYALLLAVAATLGTMGAVFVAAPASAFALPTTTIRASTLRACDGSACTADTPDVASGRNVTSFCTLGASDLVYTGSVDRRGGFIPRANLADRTQFTVCNSNPEFGVVTVTASTLRSCASSTCRSFGAIPQNVGAAAFCNRSTFVLIYVPPIAGSSAGNKGGFYPRSALAGNLPFASC
ncbi:hypothetical protein WEI85_32975 [Actinomycetes bacterium KLBMP 9797]